MVERKSLDELELMSPKDLNVLLLQEVRKILVDIRYIDGLLNAGAFIDARDEDDRSALHFAVYHGRLVVVKALLEAGASLEAKDYGEYTPLHWAARFGHIDIVKALLEAGASKEAPANKGKTPWDEAKPPIRKACPQLNPDYNG